MSVHACTSVKSGSAGKVGRKFWCEFQDVTALHIKNIHRIVIKLNKNG
jgi:hypothetical protein